MATIHLEEPTVHRKINYLVAIAYRHEKNEKRVYQDTVNHDAAQ